MMLCLFWLDIVGCRGDLLLDFVGYVLDLNDES